MTFQAQNQSEFTQDAEVTTTPDSANAPEPSLLEQVAANDPVLKNIRFKLSKGTNGRDYIRLDKVGNKKHALLDLSSKQTRKILIGKQLKCNFDMDINDIEREVDNAIKKLESIAADNITPEQIFNRIANVGGTVFLNLNNQAGEVVEITANGWRIITDCPVLFISSPNALPLPTPIRGGNLEDFKKLLKLDDKSFVMLIAWNIMALRGLGPYPILNYIGPPGAAKSTRSIITRLLIDPKRSPMTKKPRSSRDLDVVAANNAIVSINNVSDLSDEMSDSLCIIATEGGSESRQLYTDSGECILDTNRPVIVNGISKISTRGDLLDRTIFINLERLTNDRATQAEIMEKFAQMQPAVLGVLLDGVSAGLKHFGDVKIDPLPRMADFATFICAAAKGINGLFENFLEYYIENENDVLNESIDNSPTAYAVKKLLESKNSFLMTMSELLNKLRNVQDKNLGNLPDNAQKLANELKRIEHLLTTEGIKIEKKVTGKARLVQLTKMD